MKSTQDGLIVKDIRDDLIFLKDGGAALVLQTTAVNFDLLTELEQVAIISAFGQTLNSLSFPIQIVIRSQRLDITSYLRLLNMAISTQANPLLSKLMEKYRSFVQSLIKQNEVLDKHFFIVIHISSIELGVFSKKEDIAKKAKTMLAPRHEQIARQLSRVGLKTTQLGTKALVLLFYNIYNPPQEILPSIAQLQPTEPQPINPKPTPQIPVSPPISDIRPPISEPRPTRNHPFVVEELADTI